MNAKSLDELHAVKEKRDDTQRDDAQRDYSELTEKKQVQIRMRLTDAVFARMVVDVRSMLDTMPPEHKAGVDGDFLMAIAEQPNEIPKTVCFFNIWEYMTYLGLQMLHKCIIFAIDSTYIAKFSNNLTIWANL